MALRAADFRKEVERHCRVIFDGLETLVRLGKVNGDPEEATHSAHREGLQLNVASVSIAAAAEALMKLIHELKLSLLMAGDGEEAGSTSVEDRSRATIDALAARVATLKSQLLEMDSNVQ